MNGKTCLITGGNDGIGYQTALDLARMGANMIIVCRNEDKANAAVKKIKSAARNNSVEYVIADLSSQKSIRNAAEKICGKEEKVDVLINNAGGTFSDFELTEDGLEKTIATNHFAYFLLTGLLLGLVKKSAYARIVNVASDSHLSGKIDFDSFTGKKNYFVLRAYEQSKLANVLFTFELAERLKHTHVTANCLHPGFVKTQIGKKSGHAVSALWMLLTAIAGKSWEKGAQTSVFLASAPEAAGVTGKYFANRKPSKVNPLANDISLRKKLWEISEKFSRFNYNL